MIGALKKLFGSAEAPATQESAPPILVPDNAVALRRYAALCRAAGVDRLYLVLTFDCDTDPDIDLALDLDTDLRRRGIRAGYAVPGVQLEKGTTTWRKLADTGAEFLNHGARAHAEWRDGRYWPVTFYHEFQEREVVDDITAGHQVVSDVIGAPPEGFRAPHFGSYQEPEQLDVLYRTLRPLGYRYCSTTIPQLALTRGPLIDMRGIVELPTMGSYRNPTTLLDSWTYLTDRTRYALGDEYFELFDETVTRMTQERLPGVLTYYADPSHVVGQKPFERALDVIARYHVPSLQGREAVRKFRAL
jgi:peptidoglycan/xylan/chitin deacetylase (PgdA/CDA1 family)